MTANTPLPDDSAPDRIQRFSEAAELDAENESQRLRILELTKWMEEAVTAQVACERRLDEIDTHRRSLETELDAIHQSRTWRLLAPARRGVARLRGERRTP